MRRALAGMVDWRSTCFVLLVAVVLSPVAPLLDHHAVERNPWHSHLGIGVTESELTQILASHGHLYEQLHSHDWAGRPTSPRCEGAGAPHVIAIANGDDMNVQSDIAWQALASQELPSLEAAFDSAMFFPTIPTLLAIDLAVPKPPPRSFSETLSI